MASSYFNIASYARAKKNKDDLEKTQPQKPVLKDEDEKFLERVASSESASNPVEGSEVPTKISDDGEEKVAAEKDVASDAPDQAVIPETRPPASDASSRPTSRDKKGKDRKSFDLPSQEEAEAATRGWSDQVKLDDDNGSAGAEKRTWASFLPSIKSPAKRADNSSQQEQDQHNSKENETSDSKPRTWTEYASSITPSIPSLPAWTKKSKDKDSEPEPVYNEDGTINEEKTKEKQEKEVSVLLDNLNMSTINNRVFALNQSTQHIYDRFAEVLKDTINGGPTAYEDMEKLMKEAGPQLEKQFKSMPPFVQTLVKSLPAKLSGTLGPELLAAASEKPGADMKTSLESASKGETVVEGKGKGKEPEKKSKRRIPGIKSLISKEGAVAGILRNTVNFIQTRFPFLASTTNVVMSLAVFSKLIIPQSGFAAY